MKKIGIVGGVAWPSTVEYYSELCRRSAQWSQARTPNATSSTLEISIESLDIAKAVAYLGRDVDEQSWYEFDEYHRVALKRVEASGADFAIIASNTPHHRFESIVRGIEIPVINIFEEVAKASERIGARHVVLLGTALTMTSDRFRDEFAKHGIEGMGPQDDTARMQTIELIADLQHGKLAGAGERLGKIATKSLRTRLSERTAVCLACTELPLVFEQMKQLSIFQRDGILFINATAVHIQAAFNHAVGSQ